MFLEVINDLFMSSSVFYVYFGMLLMTVGISQLFVMQNFAWQTRTNIAVNEQQHLKVDDTYCLGSMTTDEIFINWFVKSFKQIDAFDDDKEDVSNSYFKQAFKIRGGRLWKQTTYSQPFGRLALAL